MKPWAFACFAASSTPGGTVKPEGTRAPAPASTATPASGVGTLSGRPPYAMLYATLSAHSAGSCCTNAMVRRRWCGCSERTSWPSTSTVPASAS